jgi:glutamine---fructose-6-phosphate transaminase (isomerizing)
MFPRIRIFKKVLLFLITMSDIEMSITEQEMRQGIEQIIEFNPSIIYDLVSHIKDRSIFIVGMGSSILMPGGYAKHLASSLPRRIEVEPACSLTTNNLPKDAFVFLNSNSGATIEVTNIAFGLQEKEIPYFCLSAVEDSPLIRQLSNGNHYILNCGFEQGIAATKSVVEQTLFFNALIYALAGHDYPLGKANPHESGIITRIMGSNLNRKLDELIVSKLSESETIYWIDHKMGVGEELALKTAEITGIKGHYYPGTQILHGPAEAISEKDAVIIADYGYSTKDYIDIQKLADKTGVFVVGLKQQTRNVKYCCGAASRKTGEVYCHLAAGWNVLTNIARRLGRDIDNPVNITKYRC